jgi:hypothetical protein
MDSDAAPWGFSLFNRVKDFRVGFAKDRDVQIYGNVREA